MYAFEGYSEEHVIIVIFIVIQVLKKDTSPSKM